MEWKQKCNVTLLGKSMEEDAMKVFMKFLAREKMDIFQNSFQPTQLDIYRHALQKTLAFDISLSNIAGLNNSILAQFYGQNPKKSPKYFNFKKPTDIISIADIFNLTIVIFQCNENGHGMTKFIDMRTFNDVSGVISSSVLCFMVEWQKPIDRTAHFFLWRIADVDTFDGLYPPSVLESCYIGNRLAQVPSTPQNRCYPFVMAELLSQDSAHLDEFKSLHGIACQLFCSDLMQLISLPKCPSNQDETFDQHALDVVSKIFTPQTGFAIAVHWSTQLSSRHSRPQDLNSNFHKITILFDSRVSNKISNAPMLVYLKGGNVS